MTAPDELVVRFCGVEHTVPETERLTFGRAADIEIDDNRFLHRVLGEFLRNGDLWWLHNVGSNISLSVHDTASTSVMRVAPGTSAPLAFGSAVIRFDAGGRSYEIEVATGRGDERSPNDDGVAVDRLDAADPSEMTTTTSNLPLTPEQHQLLVALATPVLAGEELPTNRQLASSLAWTITKYNRKLDGLCAKYAKAGVTGLRGSADQLAKDRRVRLAEHVIDAGIVDVTNAERRPSASGPDA